MSAIRTTSAIHSDGCSSLDAVLGHFRSNGVLSKPTTNLWPSRIPYMVLHHGVAGEPVLFAFEHTLTLSVRCVNLQQPPCVHMQQRLRRSGPGVCRPRSSLPLS